MWQNRALLFLQQCQHLSVSSAILGLIPMFHSCHCPYCWKSNWSFPTGEIPGDCLDLSDLYREQGWASPWELLPKGGKKKKHRKVFWEGFISRKGHVDSEACARFQDVTFLEYWGHYGLSVLFLEARSKQWIEVKWKWIFLLILSQEEATRT